MHALLFNIDRRAIVRFFEAVYDSKGCRMSPPHCLKNRFVFKIFYWLVWVFIPFIASPFAPPASDTEGGINKHTVTVGVDVSFFCRNISPAYQGSAGNTCRPF